MRAASYRHTLGGAVGLLMLEDGEEPVNQAWISSGSWPVEINGKSFPCSVSLKSLYDPENEKIKA